MLPRLAVVDPELTLDLPPALTASTGLDALTQLIEPFVSVRANAMTDLYCPGRHAAGRARAGARLYRRPRPRRPATTCRWPACSAGWRWPTRDWARCTGLPRPSAACLRCAARRGLRGAAALCDGGEHPRVARARRARPCIRYAEVARILTGRPDAAPEDGIQWVAEVCRDAAHPAAARLRHSAGRRAGAGGKRRQSQQHEGQPDRAHHRRDGRDPDPRHRT